MYGIDCNLGSVRVYGEAACMQAGGSSIRRIGVGGSRAAAAAAIANPGRGLAVAAAAAARIYDQLQALLCLMCSPL